MSIKSIFTRTKKLSILIFGILFGIFGVYGAWLDNVGRYMEMGWLFLVWIVFHLPVYLISLSIAPLFGLGLKYYLITFVWWTILGSSLMFIFLFFIDYFNSIQVEP